MASKSTPAKGSASTAAGGATAGGRAASPSTATPGGAAGTAPVAKPSSAGATASGAAPTAGTSAAAGGAAASAPKPNANSPPGGAAGSVPAANPSSADATTGGVAATPAAASGPAAGPPAASDPSAGASSGGGAGASTTNDGAGGGDGDDRRLGSSNFAPFSIPPPDSSAQGGPANVKGPHPDIRASLLAPPQPVAPEGSYTPIGSPNISAESLLNNSSATPPASQPPGSPRCPHQHISAETLLANAPPKPVDAPLQASPIAAEKLILQNPPSAPLSPNHEASMISSHRLMQNYNPALHPPKATHFPHISSERLLHAPKPLPVREGISPHPQISTDFLLSRQTRPLSPRSASPSPSEPIRSPAYSQDFSPNRTTVPQTPQTLRFDSAESVVSLGDFSPAVSRTLTTLQTNFQSDDAAGKRSELTSGNTPAPYTPAPYTPAPYQQRLPDDADFLTQALAATAHMQHNWRMEKYGRSIHRGGSEFDAPPSHSQPHWQNSPATCPAKEGGAADVSFRPAPPTLPRPQQFKNEEAFFSELRTQLYHTDHELDKYRGLLEHAMSSVLDAKSMLPPSDNRSPQAWQQGYSTRVTPSHLAGARDRVQSLVAPVMEQVDAMSGYGEALIRRKKHMEGQLKASRAVLAASMERESLKQAQVVNMDKDAWEGANNMLNSLVSVLLPHLSQLQAIPANRRTPSENTAVQVLSAAAGCQ